MLVRQSSAPASRLYYLDLTRTHVSITQKDPSLLPQPSLICFLPLPFLVLLLVSLSTPHLASLIHILLTVRGIVQEPVRVYPG